MVDWYRWQSATKSASDYESARNIDPARKVYQRIDFVTKDGVQRSKEKATVMLAPLALASTGWYWLAISGSVGTELHRCADCGKTTAIGRHAPELADGRWNPPL